MTSSHRYFPATILGGHLPVRRIPDRGPWDPARLEREPEEYVELMLTAMMARKVQTPEKLEAVMKEPRNVAPTREVWMHESLQDEARRLWELMVADLEHS